MGGFNGEVRGKSKIDVYLEYKDLTENDMMKWRIPDPKYKKHCKKMMEWDSETEEWVLLYHLILIVNTCL